MIFRRKYNAIPKITLNQNKLHFIKIDFNILKLYSTIITGIKSIFTNIYFTLKLKSNHNHFFTL